jgi:hypothetical protein
MMPEYPWLRHKKPIKNHTAPREHRGDVRVEYRHLEAWMQANAKEYAG